MYDTHEMFKTLTAAGFTDVQAEAIIAARNGDSISTASLKAEIVASESRTQAAIETAMTASESRTQTAIETAIAASERRTEAKIELAAENLENRLSAKMYRLALTTTITVVGMNTAIIFGLLTLMLP